MYMVLSVNKFQFFFKKVLLMLISQPRARPIDGTTDIKLLLPRWGYTAQTLLVVRWQKCTECNSVKPTRVIKRKSRACTERVEAAWRSWTLPERTLRASGQIPSGKTQTSKLNVYINLKLPHAVTALFRKWKVSLKKVLRYSH